jgi:hypothetical protein
MVERLIPNSELCALCVGVAEPKLQSPRVVTRIGQQVTARVAQLMWMTVP